ncbi:hypothetical protein KC356_g4676 [Hortaea werneckii]|nr:hypothetical protein KC356_g4676 [Hortaea werneckii]
MPAAYTAQQKSAISEFTSVTQSDKTTAAKILRQHNWNVGGAINGKAFQEEETWNGDAPGTFENLRDISLEASTLNTSSFAIFSGPSLGGTEEHNMPSPLVRDRIAEFESLPLAQQTLFLRAALPGFPAKGYMDVGAALRRAFLSRYCERIGRSRAHVALLYMECIDWKDALCYIVSKILPADKRPAQAFLLAPVWQQKSWLTVALQLEGSALADFESLRPLAKVVRLDCLCVSSNISVRSVIQTFSLPPAWAHFLPAGESLGEQRQLVNYHFRSLPLQDRVDYYGITLAGFNRTSYVCLDPIQRHCYVEAACVRNGILEEHLNRSYYCEFAPYFSNSNGASNPARPALSKIFDKYRDNPGEEPDEINIDGLTELLGELDIEPGDMGALIFSEIVSSPSLGKVTREGFVDGWSELGVDNLPKMKDVCQQRRLTLSQDMGLFKNVYNAAFPLSLPPGSKTLPLEYATEFWTMLFTPPGLEWKSAQGTPWLDWWLEFQQQIKTKAVNRDLWKQTLNFARETLKDDSLSFWSEESSWPSVIDEFVEWVKTEKRPGENGGNDEAMEVE